MSRVGSGKSRAKTKAAQTKAGKKSAGWKQARAAMYDAMHGTVKRDVRAGIHEVKAGKPGMDFVNFATGFVRNAIQEVPRNAANVGKMISGTFKGIFNHPTWYEYKGTLSIPAHNIMRPFTPTSLRPVQPIPWSNLRSGKVVGSGAGVTHVSQVAIKFNDMLSDDAFKLAAVEAFRAIRLDLRSNLPYEQDSYNNYVMMASSILVKAKAIEKMLGWYNYTRADIPEFSRATQTLPANYTEQGFVTPTDILMLYGDNYARTLNDFKKLKAIINNIAIPKKLAEYISWWVGSMFIDQAAPNPQIYTTVLRNAVRYSAVKIDQPLVQLASWDIATGGVDEVIEEAMNLLDIFGVLNADIIKTGRYGICDVVLPEQYQYNFLNDPEFFSILINAYGVNKGASVLNTMFKDDYIRVDALEELNDTNLVGMTNALAKWAGVNTLCTIESQCCYLQVDAADDLPSGGSTKIITSGGYDVIATNESNGVFLQITGLMTGDEDFYITNTAGNATFVASPSVRASTGVIAATTAITANIGGTLDLIGFRDARSILCKWTATGVRYGLSIEKGSSSIKVRNLDTATDIATLTFSGTITWVGNLLTITTGTASIATTYKEILGDTTVYKSEFADSLTFTATYTVSATPSTVIKKQNESVFAWFPQLVDYHLPIIKQVTMRSFLNGTKIADVVTVPQLLKECYKPMIFNYADISVVLYWMYLGLFSMD